MKIFLAILTLLGIFTINAFAQMGGGGINQNTVAPPAPGAPPAIPRPAPTPVPKLNDGALINQNPNTPSTMPTMTTMPLNNRNRGINPSTSTTMSTTTMTIPPQPTRPGTQNPGIQNNRLNCDNLTGADLVRCRQGL